MRVSEKVDEELERLVRYVGACVPAKSSLQ